MESVSTENRFWRALEQTVDEKHADGQHGQRGGHMPRVMARFGSVAGRL